MKNNIGLRPLREEDAGFMYEWMTDPDITACFRFDTEKSSLQSALQFIADSKAGELHRHFAIADAVSDEYMGTVSLKNIDREARNGEYAIVLRKKYHGHGYGYMATRAILDYAFTGPQSFERVYLNVLSDNYSAVKFYEQFGFIYEGEFLNHIFVRKQWHSLRWYRLLRNEYLRIKEK